MIRLVLIDDHSLVLQGLENYFLKEDDFKIIGSYTEVADLLLCLKHEKVDVLVMDFMLKGVTAFDVISQINRFLNTVPKIVLLSGFYDTLLHKRAMDFGIQAFLPKESSYLDVKSAIYAVYKGNHVIPDGLLEKQENNLLTDTELSVLELIVKEYSNEKIANSLFVSRRTVDTHVSNICSKLGVTSRVGAVREAIRLNLVSL